MPMKSLSETITDFYLQKNIIKPDMKNVYQYGISLIVSDIINFTMILLLSVITGNIIHGITFLITFCTTRVYCGGFHAKKIWICRCTMVLTFLLICLAVRVTDAYYTLFWSVLIDIIAILILIPIIPIENPNKKLTIQMKKKNKRRGICVTLLFCMLSIILTAYTVQEGAVISFTILSVAVLAVVGKINNKRGGVDNEKNT